MGALALLLSVRPVRRMRGALTSTPPEAQRPRFPSTVPLGGHSNQRCVP